MIGLGAAISAGAVVGYVRSNEDIRRRSNLALHVLRGRPAAYRLDVDNGVMHLRAKTHVVECTFRGAGVSL